jgi:flagellar basal-body rod protein FlgF
MNSGIYTAYSGMKAQADALEILSNNLANANTTAFKEDTAFYTYLNESAGSLKQRADLNNTINGSVKIGSFVNSEMGAMSATSRELDLAIEGNGFLVVNTPNGIRYTRNGSLNLNSKSVLVAVDGSPVLGMSGKPITLGPGKIAIGEKGEVFLDKTQIDCLKVVTFDKLSSLQKEGNSLFKSQADRSLEKGSDAKIKSGYLEQSNVNPVSSIVRMVEILRHFEAIQKSINLVMNDMNAKAIEKLGR